MFHLILVWFVSPWTSCEGNLRIIGGRDVLPDEFPYVVRLEVKINESSIESVYNYLMFCTGAALTSRWVLSAAHCVDDDLLGTKRLLFETHRMFARYNSHFPNYAGVTAPIIETVTHPGWTSTWKKAVKFDISLIRCDTNISKYGKINAVDYNSLIGHEAFSLGFGITNASSFVKPLQMLRGMVNRCQDKETEEGMSHMICFSRSCDAEATVCPGDSGGPVVHASGVIGVHSMGTVRCHERMKNLKLIAGTAAVVISPVSPAIDWLTYVIYKYNKINK